jgi:quercetin dioxygenase-like cupin family protein
MANGSKVIKCTGYRWSGIDLREYKAADAPFKDVTRQTLLGEGEGEGAGEDGLPFVTRYFEVAPGGYTTLEQHQHPHTVIVVRGSGTAVLGENSYEIGALDCVYVAPDTIHQFKATGREPLGFICIVDRVRDRPTPITRPRG